MLGLEAKVELVPGQWVRLPHGIGRGLRCDGLRLAVELGQPQVRNVTLFKAFIQRVPQHDVVMLKQEEQRPGTSSMR